MSFESDVRTLQAFAGVPQDAQFGPKTAAALVAKLQLSESAPARPGALRVCVDAGHGMGNRRVGLYDPGAVHGALNEADITLAWALKLETALIARGIEVFMTRRGAVESVPVGARAVRAANAGCTALISIHVNDADDPKANGCETLFLDDRDFASAVHRAMAHTLRLRDRGVKHRSDLAVLKFNGLACLIEVGFIQSAADMAAARNLATIEATCDEIAAAIQKAAA